MGSELFSDHQKESDQHKSDSRNEAGQGIQLQAENNETLRELRKIADMLKSHVADNELQGEWKHVGQILDRFFFVIFIVIKLSLMFVCLGLLIWG